MNRIQLERITRGGKKGKMSRESYLQKVQGQLGSPCKTSKVMLWLHVIPRFRNLLTLFTHLLNLLTLLVNKSINAINIPVACFFFSFPKSSYLKILTCSLLKLSPRQKLLTQLQSCV